tara:strand:- start:48 stop:302 length:255 start_codon:yes stop_codon:yes gene_type:complete
MYFNNNIKEVSIMELFESIVNNETVVLTWSWYSPSSIRHAEQRKLQLENAGFTLVMSGSNSLTYQKLNNAHQRRVKAVAKEGQR